VVLFGGDVSLARGLGSRILRKPETDPFAGVAPLLASADLVFFNLESQLSDQKGETQADWNPLVFTGPPGGADVLSRAGIHAVSLANNHIWDYGRRGFFQTLANLKRVGVTYVGASEEPARMYEPAVLRIKGFSVALFAVTQIWNQGEFRGHAGEQFVAWAMYDRLDPYLRKARQQHDLVLLSYHGGGEYLNDPLTWTRDFARRAMQAGVDAFAGHHPHVPHGVGWEQGRPIFYSLGNLVFHMHKYFPWTGLSYLARVTFRRAAAPRVEVCPYRIVGDEPQPLTGAERPGQERLLRRHLQQLSLGLGGTKVGEPADSGCLPLSPAEHTP
jgi:poly-gamma-glutamate synthesis protein (capsule biosynthesis protein)